MSFADLKNRGKNFADLVNKVNSDNKSYDDPREWVLTRDSKTGNGEAVIRFLPETNGSENPFVLSYSHSFQGKGGWYIENCPTTLGSDHKCPVCEANNDAWNAGDKTTARNRARRKNYYTNIYVVNDPAHPENNGKVFLFRFGKFILEMIAKKIKPEFESDQPVNVFDLWEGCNLRLRARINKESGFVTYDSSVWEFPSQLLPTDAELEEVWKQQYRLEEFAEADKFKNYGELKARFNRVLGLAETAGDDDAAESPEAPIPSSNPAARFNQQPVQTEAPAATQSAPLSSEPIAAQPVQHQAPAAAAQSEEDELAKYRQMLGM